MVTDVNLLIGGSACTATAGATTVGIDHTFINDLQVRLTSPSGTTVTVINEIDGGGNNLCQTLLDDEGATSIQGVVSAQAPFTGTFTPNAPLSAFDGETPNGTWGAMRGPHRAVVNGPAISRSQSSWAAVQSTTATAQ